MVYILPGTDNSYLVFDDISDFSEEMRKKMESVKLSDLPIGEGILKRRVDGSFYYEPFPDQISEPDPQPSAQDIQTQTLLNTEYLVAMSELSNI